MDLQELVIAAGYVGLFAIIFSESGLLFGVFFPGDSILFTAGFLASQGLFSITWLIVGFFVAAVLGDNVGYTFGRRVGRRLFNRQDSAFFHRDNLVLAEQFYQRHGGKTIVLARFIPAIRTLAPIVAGIGEMRYRTFLSYNILGGLLWAVGLTYLGYKLGSTIPGIDQYLIPLVGFIITISLLPGLWQVMRTPKRRQEAAGAVKRAWGRLRQR